MAEADASWVGEFSREAQSSSATDAVRSVFGAGVWSPADPGTGLGGGGSWSFDPDQMDKIIDEWESLLEELKKDSDKVRLMGQVLLPPSDDQPTTNFARNVLDGVDSLQSTNESIVAYVEDFLNRLVSAKAVYQAQDALNESSISTPVDGV